MIQRRRGGAPRPRPRPRRPRPRGPRGPRPRPPSARAPARADAPPRAYSCIIECDESICVTDTLFDCFILYRKNARPICSDGGQTHYSAVTRFHTKCNIQGRRHISGRREMNAWSGNFRGAVGRSVGSSVKPTGLCKRL